MSQPEWKLLWATDQTALFEDTTGVYAPEMEVADEIFDVDEDDEPFILFRFSLDKLKRVRDPEGREVYIVSDNYDESWSHALHQYEEWFIKDLPGVASSMGTTRDELEDAFVSDDPNDRAWAYESIGRYHGFENLDGYPLRLSEEELEDRWGD